MADIPGHAESVVVLRKLLETTSPRVVLGALTDVVYWDRDDDMFNCMSKFCVSDPEVAIDRLCEKIREIYLYSKQNFTL